MEYEKSLCGSSCSWCLGNGLQCFEKHLDKLEVKMRVEVSIAGYGMDPEESSVFLKRHRIWPCLEPLVTCCRPHFTLAPHRVSRSSVVRASVLDHRGSWV